MVRFSRFVLIVVLACAMTFAGRAPAAPPARLTFHARLLRDYETQHAKFAAQMETLAREVEGLGAATDAETLRTLALQPEERTLQLMVLPDRPLPQVAADLPPAERNWRQRQRALEADYALALYKLGNQAKSASQISLAWRFIREAAYRNPDLASARAALGFVLYDNHWMTPFRKQMLTRGNVWSDQWGWVPAVDLPRYQQGLRRAPNGGWEQADKVNAMRANWADSWEVDSEHFHVRSNHSLERAVEISVELERFYDYFVREFSAVFMTPQQMTSLLKGGADVVSSKRHHVHYYRTQKEYQERLIKKQPEAAFSNGLYRPDDRIAHFFDRPGENDVVAETMYHEVTHQILSESARKTVGLDNWVGGDFWLVEGLACYLESFRPQGRTGEVGDPRHPRIAWARKFLVEDGFHVPLERFTGLTQLEYQCADMLNGPERIRRLQQHYSQAAGVTHFFMHYRDREYREALIEYLAQIYSADQQKRRNNATLAELTGVPFAELDRQYQEYMRGLGESSAELQSAADQR